MPEVPWNLDGKLCVITGATSGIGRATAVTLADRGARLALLYRDRDRAEETVAEILDQTGNKAVELFMADLGSQEQIRRVAAQILDRCPEIHVLLNNAGLVELRRSETVDGIETTWAVNHLGPFLLTHLLLDRIRASAPARIINVSSEGHRIGSLDFDDLENRKRYRSMRVYGQSKLANLLFTYELARRLEGTGVTVNAVHPGAVATRLGQQNGFFSRLLTRTLHAFFLTPEQGAFTSIYLARTPELSDVSGRYFVRCEEKVSSKLSRDEAVAQRLWKVSMEQTGLAPAESDGGSNT